MKRVYHRTLSVFVALIIIVTLVPVMVVEVIANFDWAWPVLGRGQETPYRGFTGSNPNTHHSGVDLNNNHGAGADAPIVAVADGVINSSRSFDHCPHINFTTAGCTEAHNNTYGNSVVIDHGNGMSTRYGHLRQAGIRLSGEVKKGDIIGYVGSSGMSTNYHLHFEVMRDGVRVNPLNAEFRYTKFEPHATRADYIGEEFVTRIMRSHTNDVLTNINGTTTWRAMNGENKNQMFRFKRVDNDNIYRITSEADGKFLDVAYGTEEYSRVYFGSEAPNANNQLFRIERREDGQIMISPKSGSRWVLDGAGNPANLEGNAIWTYTRTNSPNQNQWFRIHTVRRDDRLDDDFYAVVGNGGNFENVLTNENGMTKWRPDNGSRSQIMRFHRHSDDNTYTVSALSDGKALDVDIGGGTENGRRIYFGDKHDRENQRFWIERRANGNIMLGSRSNFRWVVDGAGNSSTLGGNQLYTFMRNDTAAQWLGLRIIENVNKDLAETSIGSQITRGQRMEKGQCLLSDNRKFKAVMQYDGNFVVYNTLGVSLFGTGKENRGNYFILQNDGNLVVYGSGGNVEWSPNKTASRLKMQDDGNLVATNASGQVVWASDTVSRGTGVFNTINVPTAPQNFTVTAGNAVSTLSWSAPASNGGGAITRYEVSSNGGTSWVTASSNISHTFTGLINGTTYAFGVRAVNSAGGGAVASRSATPGLPTAPQNITATSGNGQITLNWNAPANDNGSPIIRYEVVMGYTDDWVEWIAVGNNTSYTFTGLNNGQYYMFRVRAVNSNGNSPSATLAVILPPNLDENLQIIVVDNSIQIYNPTDNAVSCKGLYITDNYDNTFQWQMPSLIIQAGATIPIGELKRGQVNFDVALAERLYLIEATGDIVDMWERKLQS